MGTDPLDPEDPFWEDMEEVVFICVKKDKTINLRTSVMDIQELKSVLSTAYVMALFQDMKSSSDGVDRMH